MVHPAQTSISIHLMLMLIQLYIQSFEPIPDFNTSHVNVNRVGTSPLFVYIPYFNTSHVNVNPPLSINFNILSRYFNTSHVNVNPTNLSLFNHA